MCGLAGAFGVNPRIDDKNLARQIQLLECRGPDGNGIREAGSFTFIHTLLAIQDPGRAKQPMSSRSGISTIVFNGEIYNFKNLIKRHNLKFLKTRSDTEVVLELYDQHGPEIIGELEGMFAFAIFDDSKQELLLARDKFGEKPLFFCKGQEALFFSSNPLSLRDFSVAGIKKDQRELAHYFKYNYLPEGNSLIDGINQVIPGKIITFQIDLTQQEQFVKWKSEPRRQSFREVFVESVSSCLVSDVPVGLSLSGGVDSTITLLEMTKLKSRVQTFTVVFDKSDVDAAFAKRASKLFNSEHHEIRISDYDLPNLIHSVLGNQPIPFGDSSIVPAYALAKYANQFVKVLVSGDGADEILSGYEYYRKYGQPQKAKIEDFLQYFKLKLEYLLIEGLHHRKDFARLKRIRELEFILSLKTPFDLWNEDISILDKGELKNLGFSQKVVSKIARRSYPDFQGVQTVMEWDRMSYLPGDILWKSDTAGMMASLEVRTPFLNSNLVNWAKSIDFSKELSKQEFLRIEYRGEIPDDFFTRKKKGFGAPIESWLNLPGVRELFMDSVLNRRSKIYDLLSPKIHVDISKLNSQTKWNMLALSLWLDKNA